MAQNKLALIPDAIFLFSFKTQTIKVKFTNYAYLEDVKFYSIITQTKQVQNSKTLRNRL